MGSITIVELNSVGGQGAVDGSPVVNVSAIVKTTVDATTSTTAESVTLDPNTRYVVVTADELHRVSVKDSDATDRYITVGPASPVDLAVNMVDRILYYRTDV